MVVAIIDQNTCKTFKTEKEAPADATLFFNAEDFEKVLTAQSMDKIRGRLLEENVYPSPSRKVASRRLWHVISIGATPSPQAFPSYRRLRDKMGNYKVIDSTPIELIQLTFVQGKNHMTDFFFKKLPLQCKTIMNLLIEEGSGIWTNDQIKELLSANENLFSTKQGVLNVWKFYRGHLFQYRILRRVKYIDFISKPAFAGTCLTKRSEFEAFEAELSKK